MPTHVPDISITTIEKALSDLLKEEYIIKIVVGRSTAYIRNHEGEGYLGKYKPDG